MNKQSGNVIFLILIAVVLFGALSMAVTQSSRTGGDLSAEQAGLYASELLQFSQSLENAIQRVITMNGCSENEISFANDVYLGSVAPHNPVYPDEHNPNAPANGRCDIFHPAGGGLVPYVLPENAHLSNDPAAGHGRFQVFVIPGVGDDGRSDLVFRVIYIDNPLCTALRRALSLPEDFDATASGYTSFNGAFPTDHTITFDDSDFDGTRSFTSTYGTPPEGCHFLHVILAR